MDSSGYAAAARQYVLALHNSNEVNLTLGVTSFENQKTTHGKEFATIQSLVSKPGVDYKINIVHLTPENYPTKREPGKYNIGYTTWEADLLPGKWTDLCNLMDEIWVPSTWNVEVFKRSGVTKPIHVVPHVVPIPDMSDAHHLTMAPDNETFVFYSIFQWIERKNPVALLKAYLTEFSPSEKVVLAIKSYRVNTSSMEQEVIKSDIKQIKKMLNLPQYPPIMFFGDLFPAEHIKGFHQRGDCFVLAHHGEGFGIPHAEAMALGKPVIATGYSGNTEFMNKENSFLIDYQISPVSGMIFPNYHGHMNWADPSVGHLKQLMRYVFQHRNEAKKVGEVAHKYIQDNLNEKVIGQIMINRLKEIQATV